MSNITLRLEKECKRLLRDEEKLIRLLKKEYKQSVNGRIYMRTRNGKPYFYEKIDNQERGVSNDSVIIENSLKHEVLEKRLKVMEHNYAVLCKATLNFKEVNLKRLLPIAEEKGIKLNLYTKEQTDWMEEEFLKNQYKPEELRYATQRGLRVRSKSERIIASRLEENQVAFRYEMGMELGYEAGYKIIYPDFVIKKENGDLVVWEHFGLMNDSDYRSNAINKIEQYRRIGYTQHKNLICTWEEDVTNANDIDEIVERFLL